MNIEEIIDELSYCFSSPEAETFNQFILDKNYTSAKDMLIPEIGDEKAQFLIDFYRNKNEEQIQIIEVSIADFSKNDGDIYLVKRGVGPVEQNTLIFHRDQWGFFTHYKFEPLEKFTQLWKMQPK